MIEMNKLVDTEHDFHYEDILYLEHHTSKKHLRQPMNMRAAQFAPFAALTGFEGEILEKERITDSKVFLDEDSLSSLNEKMTFIENNLEKIDIKVTYFVKDLFKEGGTFLKQIGQVRMIDKYHGELIFTDRCRIKIKDIVNIEINDIQ